MNCRLKLLGIVGYNTFRVYMHTVSCNPGVVLNTPRFAYIIYSLLYGSNADNSIVVLQHLPQLRSCRTIDQKLSIAL